MNLLGELIEVLSRRAGLDNVGDVGQFMKKRRRDTSDDTPDTRSSGEQARDLMDVIGSDLLDFGQLIIAGMKMTTGDGTPDDGLVFRDGHRGFNKAGEMLRSAVPDDRWGGVGSRAYADQNTRQQVRSEAMADAARAVFAVLVRECLQIKARRDTLDTQSDLLAKVSFATFPLQFIPRYGEAAKLAIESAALHAALQLCAFALYGLLSEASDNATELRQAIGRYSGVADGADLPGSGVDLNPPEPPGGGGRPHTAPAGPPMTTGTPAPGGAAGALSSVFAPLAGLVTGIALAAAEAAGAAQRLHGDDVDDDDEEAAEEAPVGAEAETGTPRLEGQVPDNVMAPQDTKLGEQVYVGG